MIRISRQEAEWLRQNGYENKVMHTYSKAKKYFCVEDFSYKLDEDGETVLSSKPVGALKALYKHREDIKK